jgi:hypothetical protein
MRRMETRQGYVKFWRLGTVEFGEQSRWSRAPRNKGLWAFPYPFYDSFFTYHKYLDIIPKRLRAESIKNFHYDEQSELYEEQEKWINTIGKRVLPIREFWYQGDVFTHFTPQGEIGEMEQWSTMDATTLLKQITSSGADRTYWRSKESVVRGKSSIDHMEVFISPRMGTIKEGKTFYHR